MTTDTDTTDEEHEEAQRLITDGGTDTQAKLVGGASGESVEIDTSGRTFRPMLHPITCLVSEAKLQFDARGMFVSAVDPANVGMVELHANAEAFDYFDASEELTIGTNLTRLRSSVSSARIGKRSDDPISLTLDETATTVAIERDYDGTELRQTAEHLNIDPDSIRQEPDLPDLELPAEATVSPSALKAATDVVDEATDHAVVTAAGDTLAIAADTDEARGQYGTAVEFDVDVDIEEGVEATSQFSLDYLSDMADALVKAKVDAVHIEWGDEMPTMLNFERTEEDTVLYEGTLMLAPRLSS